MIRSLLLILFCISTVSALSQDSMLYQKRTLVAAELGMTGIGVAAEWRHPERFTVETGIFFGPSYDISGWVTPTFPLPGTLGRGAFRFSVLPRIYLNTANRFTPRPRRYTHVDFFFGFGYSFVTQSMDATNVPAHLLNAHIGARQFFSKRGTFTAYTGLGSATRGKTLDHAFYLSLNLKVGFLLNNDKPQ